MRCPFCHDNNDAVIDSRESGEGEFVRRRRECQHCQKRFTTYEKIDEIPLMAIKKDGRREQFNPDKIFNGIRRACEKRPVNNDEIEKIVRSIETLIHDNKAREFPTDKIGQLIMEKLKKLDDVAYVRFASVYRDFQDISDFLQELKPLTSKSKSKSNKSSPPAV
jgi:transcriptional repressor NrdR